MTRFLIRRLVPTIPVPLGVATLVFSLIHSLPGDSVQAMLAKARRPQALQSCTQETPPRDLADRRLTVISRQSSVFSHSLQSSAVFSRESQN